MTARNTLVLTAGDVSRLLDLDACIDAVAQAMRLHAEGHSLTPDVAAVHVPGGGFHAKMAGLPLDGRVWVASKTNANFPGNPDRHGLPTIQGLLALFDASDGVLLAVMDSIVITSRRTGAATAVAARYLARRDSTVATIVGAGEQGDIHVRALSRVLSLRQVHLIDRNRARAVALSRRLSADLGIPVTPADSPDAALLVSDVCVTCTTSTRPVLLADQVRPGTFVAGVGADNPHKHELDPGLLSRSTVVADLVESCAAIGDLHHAIDAGVMTRTDVHAELGEVVAGLKPGRRSPDETIVFDSTGTALQDVAAAVIVYRRALEAGLGTPVPLGGGS